MAVISDLSTLVAFETVSNRPVTELAAFLSRRLEDLGFRVERFDSPTMAEKCNIVATIGPADTDGLVLSGHMDVVPTVGQPWSSDPFKLSERDGKLYARGSELRPKSTRRRRSGHFQPCRGTPFAVSWQLPPARGGWVL